MKLLVTSATSELGRTVAAALSEGNEVRLTDLPDRASNDPNVTPSELGHGDDTDELVRGLDAVVHIGHGGHRGEAASLIDYQTRCTYNLLMACVNVGVPRAFYLSTMRLLDDYEPHLTVTERWKSLPDTEPDILAAHLGEYVTREFAREEPISTAVLRLGFPIVAGSRHEAVSCGEPAAFATEDLALALRAALQADLPKWQVIHLQSPLPDARFPMRTGEKAGQ